MKVATGRVSSQVWPEHSHAWDHCQPIAHEPADVAVVGDNGRPPDLTECVDGGVQGHGPDDVRGAGLLPVGRVGPNDLVKLDEVDGTAAGKKGIAVGEGAARPDQYAGSERRVHLVPAPGEEVGPIRKRAVRRQLGGIDGDGDLPAMGSGDDLVDRR